MRKTAIQSPWAGAKSWNRLSLFGYDHLLAFHNRFIWRCGADEQARQYSALVGRNHLEIGVGTGHHLDSCRFPTPNPRLTLFDLNAKALAYATARLARYQPDCVQADVVESWPVQAHSYDSVAMNYVLHCVPGDPDSKGIVFAHAAAALKPGGVVFGATLVADSATMSAAARRAMRFYNSQQIFCNGNDTADSWRAQLGRRFVDYDLRVVGSVALFSARTHS